MSFWNQEWGAGLIFTLFNYGVTQVWSWMQATSDREVYDREVARIEKLERDDVFVRELHVHGVERVRVGWSYEEGWPQEHDSFASLRSEPIEVVDGAGHRYSLEKEVLLYVSHLPGIRKPDNAGSIFDFSISPDQRFFMLMTGAGPYRKARPGFSEGCYHFTTRLEDLESEARPHGVHAAWLLLLVAPALFVWSLHWLPDREGRVGFWGVTSSVWFFVCLSEFVFVLLPRHRTRLPVRRFRPRVRD